MKIKKITGDLLYSITAVGLMNAVLQFIVYPAINYRIGAALFGEMLFYLGIVNILSPSFGIAVNNTRLLTRDRDMTKNRDYLYIITIFSGISLIVGIIVSRYKGNTVLGMILFIYIVIVTILRNYSSVEFRLELNYKKQFFFYFILSIGYITGLIFFWITKRWEAVYIIGETAAVLFVVISGKIYRDLQEYSERKYIILKNTSTLALNYLITNLMLNLDRIVLLNLVNSEAVSQYYVLSLMGKTIAIISGPLNGILIGYLTKGNERIDKKSYIKTGGIMLGVGIVFLLGCAVVTPIYVKIMYPNLYSSIIDLNIIVNISQIFYFLAGILVVIVLTISSATNILIAQVVYSITFIVLSVILTKMDGIRGFSYSAVISNIIYFVLVYVVGYVSLSKSKQ